MFGDRVWGRDVGQGVLSVNQSSLTPHAYPPPKSCEHNHRKHRDLYSHFIYAHFIQQTLYENL